MQLGINVIHGVEDWSRFRPFSHEGLQASPPFIGTWSQRVYVDKLLPGLQYICVLSDHGSITGEYAIRIKAPAQAAIMTGLKGDGVSTTRPDVYRFGRDNAWMTIEVASELNLADLAILIFKTYKQH